MKVYLLIFNDVYQKELIGIMEFFSFKNLMEITKKFFNYNDIRTIHSAQQKKAIFKIIVKK